MSDCIQCGAAAQYRFRALEIHTLPVRDFKGEKKIQAAGDVVEFGVCGDCVRRWLRTCRGGVSVKKLAPFAVILLLGAVVSILCRHSETVYRLLGAAAVICGEVGIVSTVREHLRRRREYQALPEDKALERAAWETVLRCADCKRGDHDLSYIPITADTRKLKNGDLMVCYDLLPEIALKAWDILHQCPQST